MKICQIIYSYSPYNCGGADIYAENISKSLAKNGHESIVITTKPYTGINSLKPTVGFIDGVKVYRFYPFNVYFIANDPKKNIMQKAVWSLLDTWNFHTYNVIKNILIMEKPDIVHVHTPISISLSVFNSVKSLKIPLILTIHDYFLICKRTFLLNGKGDICKNPNLICKSYRKFSKEVINSRLDAVISPSEFTLNLLDKYGFFKDTKKIVLPNGINLQEKPVDKIKNDYIDILYIGVIAKHKGVHHLVKAFSQINNDKLRLHIAGKGPLLNELKEIAEKDNRIKFYGWVSEDKKENLLRLADVSVLPSIWYENFPVSIQENFCYSTPVIGSKIGGIPELITNGYNGFLIEAGDHEKLKSILESFGKDKSILNQMGENAFKYVKKFEMQEHIDLLQKIYNDAINNVHKEQ